VRRAIAVEELAQLGAILRERVGLLVKPDGYTALRLALAARFEEVDGRFPGPEAYLDLLRSEAGEEELRRLLPLVTVGKTSFFRDARQFTALAALLPELLGRAREKGNPVSIWSAGCATGEEVYSIAITAAEGGARPGEMELLGTDVNPEAVVAAARGAFEARRLREVRPSLVERYFEADGGSFRVRSELRRLLAGVRAHNLVSNIYPRPERGGWDMIFCRNVIIYFDTATTQEVLARFHAALAPGGYLFLGYSESLFRLFEGFELTEVAGAFIYRRPEVPVRPRAAAPPPPAAPARRWAGPVHHLPLPPGRQAAVPLPPPLAPQEALEAAVQLFSEGRFGAAQDLLERLLSQEGEHLAVRLTLANLYGILRQPDRSRESYQAALALEPLSAEAHLFFGIHLLAEGDTEMAALELSRALFLDPDLCLAHYYLGRCREAQRDVHRARLAYKNAIDAHERRPGGRRQEFLGYYPDIPEDGAAFSRAAAYALVAL
jgi:chemotaxis protein methyltransferase CheR